MPHWGWLIVMLVVVDLAVVAVWLLTRRRGTSPQPAPSFVRELDPETREHLERLVAEHQPIRAITVLRDRTGLGLADAKSAVDAIVRGEWVPTAGTDSAPPGGGWADLAPALRELKADGHPDRAARLLRRHTGMSLGEATDAVAGL